MALAVFVTTIAYLHHPRLKALVYSLPVPFACAYLATDMRINATHVTGVGLIVGYNWLVYLLHAKRGWALGAAIAAAVGMYVLGGIAFRSCADAPFPWMAAAMLVPSAAAMRWYRPMHQPGHRSRTAWWIKAPLVMLVGLVMYNLTGLLAGAVTTFPYAGTFTSYESRHSLRTLAGQFSINSAGIWASMVVMWIIQDHLPGRWPLAPGILAAVLVLAAIYRAGLGRPAPAAVASPM